MPPAPPGKQRRAPPRLPGQPRASVEIFGKHPRTSKLVHLIKLEITDGTKTFGAHIITFGASLQALHVPDKSGEVSDVVLGFDNIEDYCGRNPCFGGTPGRYANRISHGTFMMEGEVRALDINWRAHTLHGGSEGFDHLVWKIAKGPWVDTEGAYVTLSLHSPAGDQGFHAAVDAYVTYSWTATAALEISFQATADRATVVNLTNHSYFNLAGAHTESDILRHEATLNANSITEVDEDSIPTGEIIPINDTAFDFLEPRIVGERIADVAGGGYDHNYCVDGDFTTGLKRFVGRVREPTTGRCLEVWATQPGVQFYTANGDVVEGIRGKYGAVYPKHAGLCLETQHFPDSPNHENFPEVTLVPGKQYMESVAYRFSCGDPF